MLALLLSAFVYGVLGALGDQNSLGAHDCAQLSFHGHHAQYQVTDGKEVVTSTWDDRRQLVSCSLDEDAETVRDFLHRCQRKRQDGVWDFGGFVEARMACLIFLGPDTYRKRGGSAGQHVRVKRGFTYPGTLWCGVGNIAEKISDLGEHTETDSCCRTHDYCEHVIHPFTFSYGYRNYLWHTISHCDCDNRFKDCLRKVNDTASRVIGQAFFNVIQVQCFEFAYEEQCVERHWYGWCKKYENETVAVPRESGLYDYGGNTISDPLKPKVEATEDLLKIMMTISSTTSPDQTTTEKTTKKKKKDKTKHKKGKGLKGKRKNLLNKENQKSPSKGIWRKEIIKNERGSVTNTPLDSILDIGHRQDRFNDILNDEPMRTVDFRTTTIAPTIKLEAFKDPTTSLPQESRPCVKKHRRKNRKEGKGRREGKKKSKTVPCIPADI